MQKAILEKIKKNSHLSVAILGIAVSWVVSSPRSFVKPMIPKKKLRNIHLLPNLKIEREDRHYHIHHWVYLSFVYIILTIKGRDHIVNKAIRAFIVGNILHGFTYSDRFEFVKAEL